MSDGAFKGLFVVFAIVAAAVFFLSDNGFRTETPKHSSAKASTPSPRPAVAPKPAVAPASKTLESSADVLKYLVGSHCTVYTRVAGGMNWTAIYRMDVSQGGRYSYLQMRIGQSAGSDEMWEEKSVGTLAIGEGRFSDTGIRYFAARDNSRPYMAPTLIIDRNDRSIRMFNGVEELGLADNCDRYK